MDRGVTLRWWFWLGNQEWERQQSFIDLAGIKSWHEQKLRKDKEVSNMKALDKVFGYTQVITGIQIPSFH